MVTPDAPERCPQCSPDTLRCGHLGFDPDDQFIQLWHPRPDVFYVVGPTWITAPAEDWRRYFRRFENYRAALDAYDELERQFLSDEPLEVK